MAIEILRSKRGQTVTPGRPGSLRPGPPTDPDVRDYRIRFLETWVCYATPPKTTRSRGGGSG